LSRQLLEQKEAQERLNWNYCGWSRRRRRLSWRSENVILLDTENCTDIEKSQNYFMNLKYCNFFLDLDGHSIFGVLIFFENMADYFSDKNTTTSILIASNFLFNSPSSSITEQQLRGTMRRMF